MNTIETHQATLSLLDHLNSTSRNNIFGEIIAANQEKYEATLQKFGYGAAAGAVDSVYSRVETSSSNLMDSILALRKDSIYEEKEDRDKDAGELRKAVTNFISAYNTNLSNISASGKAIANTFLPEMEEAYSKGGELLEAIGVKRDSDGRLIIDQDKLSAAAPEDIKSAFGGDSEFMRLLYKSTASLNDIVGSALSYMSSYNQGGMSQGLASALGSSFNSIG